MGSNEETKSESGDLIHEVICKDSSVGTLLSAKMASLYISPNERQLIIKESYTGTCPPKISRVGTLLSAKVASLYISPPSSDNYVQR